MSVVLIKNDDDGQHATV